MGRMHCWLGMLEGCLAGTASGINSAAHRVVSDRVSSGKDMKISYQVLQTVQKAHSFSGWLVLHSVFNHVTKRQERVDITLYFLYWKFAASHSKTSLGKRVSLGSVAYCMLWL